MRTRDTMGKALLLAGVFGLGISIHAIASDYSCPAKDLTVSNSGDGGISYSLGVGIGDLNAPSGYSFDTKDGVTNGSPEKIKISVSSGSANGSVQYSKDELPNAQYAASMNGKLIPPSGGKGPQPTWDASGNVYHIASDQNSTKDVTVSVGTSVTFTAYAGASSKSSNWTVTGPNSTQETANGTASIIFNRSWYDAGGWFSTSLGKPTAGKYEISATAAEGSGADSGSLTLVDAKFDNSDAPGWDDYSNSTDQVKYYSSNQGQYCTLPYVAIATADNKELELTVTPSTISKDIALSGASLVSPASTKGTVSVEISGTTGNIKAKLGGSELATVEVCPYFQRSVNLLVVSVNGSSMSQDYTCFGQAIVSVTNTANAYSCSTFTYAGKTYTIDSNMTWTQDILKAFRDQFASVDPSYASADKVQFMLPGSYGGGVIGWSESIPGKCSWVFSDSADARTPPHELGHCLGLQHRNTDYYALMCQTAYARGAARMLRNGEWAILQP